MEFQDYNYVVHSSVCKIKTEDGIEDVKTPEGHTTKIKVGANRDSMDRKRRASLMEEGLARTSERNPKRVMLSLEKPSYLLGLGLASRSLRSEHRNRLCYLLQKLVRQRNWADASGVLSVLLKGTNKEKGPVANRFKSMASMELLSHIQSHQINPTRINNIYDIWMKRIGSRNASTIQDKVVVHLEFILFCLMRGDVEEAHQAAMSLMQERDFGSHSMSNLVVALMFCQRWFSSVPREMQWNDIDQNCSPTGSNALGERFRHQTGNSEVHDTVYSNEADTQFRYDSDTSVMVDKRISLEGNDEVPRKGPLIGDNNMGRENFVEDIQQQGLYMGSDENEASLSNGGDSINYDSVIFSLERLSSWLLPVQLPKTAEDYENFIEKYSRLLNDNYKNAVKYLRLAFHSTPPVSAALLPLIQLLLLGGRVDEAMNEVEKFCCDSKTDLPLRVRANLLECFGCNNYNMLSTCFEDILNKDPTCSHSLARLISMHQKGDYAAESLLEMIALHLDATYADYNIWREFALCFLKVSQYNEDRMSVCLDGNEGKQKQRISVRYNRTPEILTHGKSGKSWKFRCRWWLNRHFCKNMVLSEIATDDLQTLTYKAACASHMYGQDCDYVVKVYSKLMRESDRDLLMFLQVHMHNSIRLYPYFQHRTKSY